MSSVNWNARLSDIALNVKPSPIRALRIQRPPA